MDEKIVLDVSSKVREIHENVGTVIVGKDSVIELLLVAVLCGGHVLIEDVPGIGKTLLARSLATSLGCTFQRLQCTPDLLPSDITGTSIFNQKLNEFEFVQGPLFAQVVLADEINRATPRSQSGLLEAMEEKQITVDGQTHFLPNPFLVLATQNPIELAGTFPLPEAQLDRFLLKVQLGYPTWEEDQVILERFASRNPIQEIRSTTDGEKLRELQGLCRQVTVSTEISQYIVNIVHATREHPYIELGCSPRGMLRLYQSSQALAVIRGRGYVIPDDVKHLVPFVIGHRVVTYTRGQLKGYSVEDILAEVVASVAAPVEIEKSEDA